MRETIVDRAYAKPLLPPRKEDGHKGDFGKLLVLGGSVGYTGAPYLAASAAVLLENGHVQRITMVMSICMN